MAKKKWYASIDPKIRLRKGSVGVLEGYLFTPLTELQIEIPTLLATEHLIRRPVSNLQKLKTHKFVTYRLFAKKVKRR